VILFKKRTSHSYHELGTYAGFLGSHPGLGSVAHVLLSLDKVPYACDRLYTPGARFWQSQSSTLLMSEIEGGKGLVSTPCNSVVSTSVFSLFVFSHQPSLRTFPPGAQAASPVCYTLRLLDIYQVLFQIRYPWLPRHTLLDSFQRFINK
jgi:hypothetical protein